MTELLKSQPAVIETDYRFLETAGDAAIEHFQDIPDAFISELRRQKADSGSVRENEFMHVASIPAAVHELWLRRDNYDCTKEDVRTSVKKLIAENLDAFVVTNKRV